MTTTPTGKAVQDVMSDVMNDVLEIGKTSRNAQQGFAFRGIEDVINVVGPLLRKHRLIVTPFQVKDLQKERYETKGGTAMVNVTVVMVWHLTGPAGDVMVAETIGEAADSGDKAVAKAQSVAFRILLEKAFAIPTSGQNVADPDLESHQRAARASAREPSGRDWPTEIGAVTTAQAMRDLRAEALELGELTEDIHNTMVAIGKRLAAAEAGPATPPATPPRSSRGSRGIGTVTTITR